MFLSSTASIPMSCGDDRNFSSITVCRIRRYEIIKTAVEEFKLTYKEKKRLVEDQDDLLNGLKQQQQENKERKKEIHDESEFGKLKKQRGRVLT